MLDLSLLSIFGLQCTKCCCAKTPEVVDRIEDKAVIAYSMQVGMMLKFGVLGVSGISGGYAPLIGLGATVLIIELFIALKLYADVRFAEIGSHSCCHEMPQARMAVRMHSILQQYRDGHARFQFLGWAQLLLLAVFEVTIPNPLHEGIASVAVLVAVLALHISVQPYSTRSLNMQKIVQQTSATLLVVLGCIKHVRTDDDELNVVLELAECVLLLAPILWLGLGGDRCMKRHTRHRVQSRVQYSSRT